MMTAENRRHKLEYFPSPRQDLHEHQKEERTNVTKTIADQRCAFTETGTCNKTASLPVTCTARW